MNDNTSKSTSDILVELQQQLPRRVSLTSRGTFMILAVTAISLILVALAIAGFTYDFHQRRNTAVLASDGRVINTDETQFSVLRVLYINYEFTYNGNVYHGKAAVPKNISKSIMNKAHESGTLPILYLPSDPSINHPADWSESGPRPWYLLVFLLLAVVLVLSRSKEIRMNRRIARYGKVASGMVAGYKYLRNGNIRLKYEFRDGDDLLTEGRGYSPVIKTKETQITVLYLPEESGKNLPYPLYFFHAIK
jgi:hypothetical protein